MTETFVQFSFRVVQKMAEGHPLHVAVRFDPSDLVPLTTPGAWEHNSAAFDRRNRHMAVYLAMFFPSPTPQ